MAERYKDGKVLSSKLLEEKEFLSPRAFKDKLDYCLWVKDSGQTCIECIKVISVDSIENYALQNINDVITNEITPHVTPIKEYKEAAIRSTELQKLNGKIEVLDGLEKILPSCKVIHEGRKIKFINHPVFSRLLDKQEFLYRLFSGDPIYKDHLEPIARGYSNILERVKKIENAIRKIENAEIKFITPEKFKKK